MIVFSKDSNLSPFITALVIAAVSLGILIVLMPLKY